VAVPVARLPLRVRWRSFRQPCRHTLRSGLSRGFPSDAPPLGVVVPLKNLLCRRVSPLAPQESGQRGRASGSIAAAGATLLQHKLGLLILTQFTRMVESGSKRFRMKPLTSASTYWILGPDTADRDRSYAIKKHLLARIPDLPNHILWVGHLRFAISALLNVSDFTFSPFERSAQPLLFVLEVSRCSRFGALQADWIRLMVEPIGLKAFRRD